MPPVPRSSSAARVVVAVVLVAIAAAASGKAAGFAGRAGMSQPGPTVAGWGEGVLLALMAVAAGALVAGLTALVLARRRWKQDPDAPQRILAPIRLSRLDALVVALALAAMFSLIPIALFVLSGSHGHRVGRPAVGGGTPPPHASASPARHGGSDGTVLVAAAITAGVLLVAGAGAWVWSRRGRGIAPTRRAPASRHATPPRPPADVVWVEDPQTAVLQAYGVGERSLAMAGLPRGEVETPREYLARIRGELAQPAPAVSLTALYEQARFAGRPVHRAMRAAAIQAAERLRDGVTTDDERRA